MDCGNGSLQIITYFARRGISVANEVFKLEPDPLCFEGFGCNIEANREIDVLGNQMSAVFFFFFLGPIENKVK